jgi:hypothetical protein
MLRRAEILIRVVADTFGGFGFQCGRADRSKPKTSFYGVAENHMPFEPHQSLAGCITNIRWRQPTCD